MPGHETESGPENIRMGLKDGDGKGCPLQKAHDMISQAQAQDQEATDLFRQGLDRPLGPPNPFGDGIVTAVKARVVPNHGRRAFP
jgi:hypothetical protein